MQIRSRGEEEEKYANEQRGRLEHAPGNSGATGCYWLEFKRGGAKGPAGRLT